jgi:hypothetical protein
MPATLQHAGIFAVNSKVGDSLEEEGQRPSQTGNVEDIGFEHHSFRRGLNDEPTRSMLSSSVEMSRWAAAS